VELTGVPSNLEVVAPVERAGAAKTECLPEVHRRVRLERRRRHGWARTAILEILIGSAVPMTGSDVHAQLKARYPGTPVPYATVKSGLAEEVVRPSSRIERDGRDVYRAVA
jgi:hypothetical protein